MSELKPHVSAGAEWLDQERPAWFEAIDLDALDLQNSEACVLGQLSGGGEWEMVLSNFRLSYVGASELGFMVPDFSFDLTRMELEDRYRTLTELWVEEILTRLQAHEQEG